MCFINLVNSHMYYTHSVKTYIDPPGTYTHTHTHTLSVIIHSQQDDDVRFILFFITAASCQSQPFPGLNENNALSICTTC